MCQGGEEVQNEQELYLYTCHLHDGSGTAFTVTAILAKATTVRCEVAAYLGNTKTLPLNISRFENSVLHSFVQAFNASTVHYLLAGKISSLLKK
jgi:hypothetical protein